MNNLIINNTDFDKKLELLRAELHHRIDLRGKLESRLSLFKTTGMLLYDNSEMWQMHMSRYGEAKYKLFTLK